MTDILDRIDAWAKWEPPIGYDVRKHAPAPAPVTFEECAKEIRTLRADRDRWKALAKRAVDFAESN